MKKINQKIKLSREFLENNNKTINKKLNCQNKKKRSNNNRIRSSNNGKKMKKICFLRL